MKRSSVLAVSKAVLVCAFLCVLLLVTTRYAEAATDSNPPSSTSSAIAPASSSSAALDADGDTKPQVIVGPTAEEEKSGPSAEVARSWQIWFILMTLVTATLLVYLMIKFKFHFLPESIVVVFLGAVIGFISHNFSTSNWVSVEAFPSTAFFLFFLPLIIFESGYSLHKGNFFRNMGSILVFAVFGTIISAIVVGGGVWILGLYGWIYKLPFIHSLVFGSLISAVDPVATLAIFKALDVDPKLYMLVFGESVLNDAVSIVLTRTLLEFADPDIPTDSMSYVWKAVGQFLLMFLGSAGIGILSALAGALLLKHVNVRATPSLEFAIVSICGYSPYFLAEGLELSGIMAILFCGIVMAHYSHFNLSPTSQITTQQTFRMMAYLSETCVFIYIGLAIFTYELNFEASFIFWSIMLCLIGRALNIFPLSFIVNSYRNVKIHPKFQFIMWFSGLRGAIAFALSLHLTGGDFFPPKEVKIIQTTTLVIVLFTILCLGGTTMPLLKLVGASAPSAKDVLLSKTEGIGATIDADDDDEDGATSGGYDYGYFENFDKKYLKPFFRRKITRQEVDDAQLELDQITSHWYSRLSNVSSEIEEERGQTRTYDLDERFPTKTTPNTSNMKNRRLANDYEGNEVYSNSPMGSRRGTNMSNGMSDSRKRGVSSAKGGRNGLVKHNQTSSSVPEIDFDESRNITSDWRHSGLLGFESSSSEELLEG
eukprot:Nk52_evm110s221 gene=Nk52_evmTU110s221